jgi:polysaccharide biosynthesis protein PelA
MRRVVLALASLLLASTALQAAGASAGPQPVPRVIVALYDSVEMGDPRSTVIHAIAEMPLNHLGLIVRFHDIRSGLPMPTSLAGVRGVLTWFGDDAMPDPRAYLRWLEAVSRRGIPIAVVGSIGASRDERGAATSFDDINRTLGLLGWRLDGGWHTTTYAARYLVRDDRLIGFERPLPAVVPPYARVTATARDARVVVRVAVDGRPGTTSDVVIVTGRGGYIAPGYAYFDDHADDRRFRQWYVNPFEFFREVFDTDALPKPDTATISGRRIYYSHVDGDGWRNLTQIEPYRTRYVMAARVVLDEILRKSSDLPVTVGAVVGDLDPAWHGSDKSLAVARDIYALPHVEASIHTYSHPLTWRAFDGRKYGLETDASPAEARGGDLAYHGTEGRLRSYDTKPFTLATEIDEASSFVTRLLPAGRRVAAIQWSGDTRPFERAVAHARLAGLANINGGDTRFDREFPSAAWVSPLGVSVGKELQVYASNSNENTYTDLWRDRFFGFSFLVRTVQNTGSPRRLKPFNLYYHMYSGERLSSLNAVLFNLAYARSLPLAPIETSRFSRIVEGFFSLRFEGNGPRRWRVFDRGALQTIRFDSATFDGVDFERSSGVIGQRHELGSLFVALDEEASAPTIALKRVASAGAEPYDARPYLVESRWRVYRLQYETRGVRFVTQGYGPGDSRWQWPHGARAVVTWRSESGRSGRLEAEKDASGLLSVRLPQLTGQRVTVSVGDAGEVRRGE